MNRRNFILRSLGLSLSALAAEGCGGGGGAGPIATVNPGTTPALAGAVGMGGTVSTNPAPAPASGTGTGAVSQPVTPVYGNKGVMFLSTRGFARTAADPYNTNKEAATLHRQECPYGASSGWKVTYLGYSDTTGDTISLLAAAVWIQQSPAESRVKISLTFGGKSGVVIAPNALMESDPIVTPLMPGAVVWSTQWYRAGSAGSGLPYQAWLYTKEMQPGAEDRDGTLAGPVGSLTDHTMTGGFDHSAFGPLSAGQGFISRGYRPLAIVGQPHPAFTGTEIVPCWIGDSINVFENDFSEDSSLMSARGFNGRFCDVRYPNLVFGQSGSNSGGFTALVGSPLFNYVFGGGGAKRKCTHLINEYGINAVRIRIPPDDIADFQWNDRAAIGAIARRVGLPYIHTTLTPCEHGWATMDDAQFAVFVQQRQIFNQRVRTQSDDAHLPGCIGYIDPCSVVENDPVAGDNVWVPAYRSDGIHPSSPGHAAMARTINPALFTDHPNPIQ